MAYRAACRNDGVVVCIGNDEGQSGDYNSGQGTWQSFTFDVIPDMDADVKAARIAVPPVVLPECPLRVTNGAVVARDLADIQSEYGV